jgi:hypothetical protein
MTHAIRRIALSLTVAASLVGAARAVVIPFNIAPDVPLAPAAAIPGGTLIGSPFTYYNIQFDVDGGAADINFRTARAIDAGGPGVDQVVSDGFNGSSVVTKGANSYLNTPFAVGELIGDGADEFQRDPDQFSVIYDGGTQTYAPGANYLGLRLPGGNYAYVRIDYDPVGPVYTVHGGAYENSGAPIAAGAVPEPSTVALAVAGAVGVGAMSRRRS